MKRILGGLLLILLSISLISCEPNKYYFKNNTRNDEIVSVELISYSPDNVAVVESTDEMLDFCSINLVVIEILITTKNEDFIYELSFIEFFQDYPHLNAPNGKGVKINYENGDFLIITTSLLEEDSFGGDAILYNSQGKFLEYFGSLSWVQNFVDLINEYFETQME